MTYLLRVSLDVEGKDLKNSPRVSEAISAIKKVSRRDNKIVILSHRGRPKGRNSSLSLKPFQSIFSHSLGRPVVFFPSFDFKKIDSRISSAPKDIIFLLENLRFLNGETSNNQKLARELAGLGDYYIDDDFATSHRENASNVGVSQLLPSRLGPNFRKELTNLNKILKKPKQPMILIIGGAKVADKIGVIHNLLPKVKYILLGGGPANTFLKAEGFNIGKSIYEPKLLKSAKRLMKSKKIILPLDWKKQGDRLLDIGPTTIDYYSQFIREAETIVWNGPLGLFENPKFSKGTYEVGKAIGKANAFTVVGGGDTTLALTKMKLRNKFDFVSTGGGAMLEYLAGKKLPVLRYIKK